jgi:hypothetical protein
MAADVDVDREVDGIGWRIRWLVHRPLARWALRSSSRAPQSPLRQPVLLLPTLGGSVFMVGLVLRLVGGLPVAAQVAVAGICVAVWVLLDMAAASLLIGQPDIPYSYLLVQGTADAPRVGRRRVSELTTSIWTERLGADGYAVYRQALDLCSRLRARQLVWFWASVPAAYLIMLPRGDTLMLVASGWIIVVVVAGVLRRRRSPMRGEIRALVRQLGQELGIDDLDALPRPSPLGYEEWLALRRSRDNESAMPSSGSGAISATRIAVRQFVVLMTVALVTFVVASGLSLLRQPPPKQPSELVAQLTQAGICHGVTTMESSHSNLYRCFDDNGGLITVADLTTIVPSQPSDYAVYGNGWIAVVSHQGTADRVAELLDGRVSPPLK